MENDYYLAIPLEEHINEKLLKAEITEPVDSYMEISATDSVIQYFLKFWKYVNLSASFETSIIV